LVIATADSRINKRICAVIRNPSSDCLIVGPLFPSSVNKRCPTIMFAVSSTADRLCGLVVRVLGYRSEGPGSIPGTTKKKVVGLERGPISLVSTTEELLDRKVTAPV
jgi:hypothetical protein